MVQTKKGLSFIVPAYNEEAIVAGVLQQLAQVLSGLSMPTEIILIDDGSTDKTGDLAAAVPAVRVIRHPVNIGYGNALKTGLCEAAYEWIGIVDADGSYPLEQLPLLVKTMEKGYDMVIAKRSNIDELDSAGKRIWRRLFIKMVQILNDSRIEDPNSGFRVIKRSVLVKLSPFLCGGFSFTTSLTVLAGGLYYFIAYIPVEYKRRIGKSKVRHLRDALRTVNYILHGIIFFNPMKFFVLLSLTVILFIFLPALIMAFFGYSLFSAYYLASALTIALLFGIAALGEIIRIAAQGKAD